MKMKKLMIAGMLALGACGMLAGCGGGDKAASSAAKAASGKPAKIVAGMDDTFAPMGFRDDSGKIVGFEDMNGNGYLDRLYVHKDYQGQGVASAICDELERFAAGKTITTHASITAKPFFHHSG